MLYFLKQTFNMHKSHIHRFLTHSPLSAITIQLLIGTDFLCKRFYLVDVVYSNGHNTEIRTVLENQKYSFVPRKDNLDCIEVSIHTVHRQQTS